ncbi:DUF2752 domain-containing protein [Nocardioides sp.]|uniref:DUF2752 domain-containing protein n=1 Tax=Nocardioides sp. TaxID=35761 RepID=UPI003D0DFCB9
MTTAHAAPRAAPTRPRRLVPPALTVAGIGLATLALRVRDPHVPGNWGVCPSYAVFGVYCPGCGGLRAVNDLAHGDFAAAASSNLLFVVSIPLIVFLLGRWAWDAWRGVRRQPTRLSSWPVLGVALAVVVLFSVARNLPTGHWLAP